MKTTYSSVKWRSGRQFCCFSLQHIRGKAFPFYSRLFYFPIGSMKWNKHFNLINLLILAYVFYFLPYIIRVSKSRTMRWSGYVARTRDKINAYNVLVGKPEGNPLEDRGMIILKLILKNGWVWNGFVWIRVLKKWWVVVRKIVNLKAA